MRPDALPVRPLGSRAVLPPPAVARLFGTGVTLRGTERVQVVRLGAVVASVPAEAGSALSLQLDAFDLDRLARLEGVRLQGPIGVVSPQPPVAVRSRLVLPDGLRRAWGVGNETTVGLGPVAVQMPVASGAEAAVEAERTLWLAAGRPDAARWLAAVDLAPPEEAPVAESRIVTVDRRVVTETDVRQARLRGKTLRIGVGQVVTPAALSLGREWSVFESP